MSKQVFGIAIWKHALIGSLILTVALSWILWPQEIKQTPKRKVKYSVKFLNASKKLASKEVKKLSIDDKIAQLIIVKADSTIDSSLVKTWVQDIHVGGICFHELSNKDINTWTTYSQSLSAKPLFITQSYNTATEKELKPITLASISNDSLLKLYHLKKIEELNKTGVNLTFHRSLCLDTLPDTLSQYSTFLDPDSTLNQMKAILSKTEEQHLLAGVPEFSQEFAFDTSQSIQRYKNFYTSLFKHGLPCLKVDLPEFNESTDVPKELNRLGFEGLLFAEGDFRSPSDNFDVLLSVSEPLKVIARVKAELEKNKKTDQLDRSVTKVFQAKKWLYPKKKQHIQVNNFNSQTNGYKAVALKRELISNSFVVLNNKINTLPINRIYNGSLLILTIGDHQKWSFANRCRSYHPAWGKEHNPKNLSSVPKLDVAKLKNHNPLVITLNNVKIDTTKDKAFIQSLNELAEETKVIVANFGNVSNLEPLQNVSGLIHSNETDATSMDLMAQLIFGGATTTGKMPVHVSDSIKVGAGIALVNQTRFKYSVPEEVGVSTDSLSKIDAIIREAQRFRATPGCQVFVAYKGNVIYNKSFGYHTYKRRTRVKTTDLYDLSSVTKVFSTTFAMMKLYDEKRIKLNHNLKKYFKREMDTITNCDVKKVKLEDLLLHKSGLQSYMPIVTYLQNKDTLFNTFDQYFCDKKSPWFRQEIGKNLYLRKDVPDSIWLDMKKIRVRRDHKYIYSDLNFNLLQKVVEKVTRKDLDKYVRKQFYVPLGLQRTTYLPINRFDKRYIVPTEDDKKWRKMLVDGYVHDQSAALLGGVGGNAGLFSNAHELGIMGQMLLNKGTYGGKRFFKSSTVEKFTEKAENTHRGLGFNKPYKAKMKFIAKSADYDSYGHTGFARTCVWVDPKNEIVFVFLSNRIHPKINNWKLNTYKVRSRVHQVIYDCLGISNDEEKVETSIEEMEADTVNVPDDLKTDE